MNSRMIIGALIGVGVLVQIAIGESGFAAGSLQLVHAAIGILGVFVVGAYLAVGRVSRVVTALTAVVLLVTLTQVVMGMGLMRWVELGIGLRALEESHRGTAYILFILGLVVSVVAAIQRRKAEKKP
ncbi:MAG: hypothetical protein QW137_05740 [Candidatus Caldarchaeum sp.]